MADDSVDGALDLSSKHIGGEPNGKPDLGIGSPFPENTEIVMPQRPSSGSSAEDGADDAYGDGESQTSSGDTTMSPSLNQAQKELAMANALAQSVANSNQVGNSPNSTDGGAGNSSRPFKMYPFDPFPAMYGQMPGGVFPGAQAASLQAMGAMGAMANMANVSPGSLYGGLESPPMGFASPISSYLAQRRRRIENRQTQNSSESPKSSSAATSSSSPSTATSTQDVANKKLKLEPDGSKDESYWERRRKNNEAAKRSRDSRRMKEEEIALRAAYLEQENLKLRAQVALLKSETAKLHYMLYNGNRL